MKVLDLFAGLGGFSEGFRILGHEVITVDNEAKFKPTILNDVRLLDPDGFRDVDVILASPPCQTFSTNGFFTGNWKKVGPSVLPVKPKAKEALALVEWTLDFVKKIDPEYWYLENPRGLLRKIIGRPTRTTWYCRWNEPRAKPTDLWGRHAPMSWPPQCKNGWPDHEKAPRGTNKGTRALKGAAERSKVPLALSLAICEACENQLGSIPIDPEDVVS